MVWQSMTVISVSIVLHKGPQETYTALEGYIGHDHPYQLALYLLPVEFNVENGNQYGLSDIYTWSNCVME